jgi:hypothetical protein
MARMLAWGVIHNSHGTSVDTVCFMPEGERPDTDIAWVRLPWLDEPPRAIVADDYLSVRQMLMQKRDEMEANAEQWALSFMGECRDFCKHTAEEHGAARWHLACVFKEVLAELRKLRAERRAQSELRKEPV